MSEENEVGHDPIAIANYFLQLARSKTEKGLFLTQLLKLSYLAHGFKLGILEEPLANEPVEAWEFGPVFSCLRNTVAHSSRYSSGTRVCNYIKVFDESKEKEIKVKSSFTKDEESIMEFVFDIYGKYTSKELTLLTHKKGSPWYVAWYKKGGKDNEHTIIKDNEIKSYFKREIIDKYI